MYMIQPELRLVFFFVMQANCFRAHLPEMQGIGWVSSMLGSSGRCCYGLCHLSQQTLTWWIYLGLVFVLDLSSLALQ